MANSLLEGKLQDRSVKHSLSDEEVAKAIVKVLMRSKVWAEHAKRHNDAQLTILSTPGLNTRFGRKDEGNLPRLVLDVGGRNADVKEEVPAFVYGPSGVQPAFSYGGISGSVGGVAYGLQDGQQGVIAGCNCGMILQVAASNGKVVEHAQRDHGLGFSFSYSANNSVLASLYGPSEFGSAGYGVNSVSYGSSSGSSGYTVNPAKGFLEKERKQGTGF